MSGTKFNFDDRVAECRTFQDAQHGGPAHDDTHRHFEWVAFMQKQLDRPYHDPDEFITNLVHIAALAKAAAESTHRISCVSENL
jgi:hypothetical protein